MKITLTRLSLKLCDCKEKFRNADIYFAGKACYVEVHLYTRNCFLGLELFFYRRVYFNTDRYSFRNDDWCAFLWPMSITDKKGTRYFEKKKKQEFR